MKIEWNKVTWYSKVFAVVLFALVYGFGIWTGFQFGREKADQKLLAQISSQPAPKHKKAIINAATFNCKGGKTISAAFYQRAVGLSLSDGREIDLEQTISGSGARYANADESIVFWNKGDTAFIQENGKETYSDCVVSAQAK